ncbi:MAG: biotin transporter BioY [Hyphomicrobiales bacterium]
MSTQVSNYPTLSSALWPSSAIARSIILAIAGSLLLWLSAKVQVPFFPVPMTMQTLVVLSIGAAFGWRLGGATVLLYLAQGAAGLPVFAGTPEKGIGLAYMTGPTGGYLVGFVLAAVIVGWLAEKGFDRNLFKMFAAMVVGNAAIYLPGVGWLAYLFDLEKALAWGLTPFIYGDFAKAGLAAALFPAIWALVKKNR